MPVHNAGPFLDRSIASIVGQSFTDFEFVIRDDGSTDGSSERLREWALRDHRIRLFQGEQIGPAASSNFVVRHARAEIVARMDADDIARADRLALQFAVLAGRPEIVLVGSLCEIVDVDDRIVRGIDLGRTAARSPLPPIFPHASVMMRRGVFDQVGGYRHECDYWEDLDLFMRISRRGKMAVICEPLVQYRLSPFSSRLASEEARVDRAVDRKLGCLELFNKGEDYDALLHESSNIAGRSLKAETICERGYLRLMAGQRPAVLVRLWQEAALSAELRSLYLLAWAAWGAIHPPSLRAAIRFAARLRIVTAVGAAKRGDVIDWQPRGGRRVHRAGDRRK